MTKAHAAGTVNITITTPGGKVTSTASFKFVTPATITSFTPTYGTTTGGTTVTINGTNFTGATAVHFGTTAATSYTVVNATEITAVTKAHGAGAVKISVTTAAGTVTSVHQLHLRDRGRPDHHLLHPDRGTTAAGPR